MFKERRYGKLKITGKIFNEDYLEALKLMYSKFIPMDIERDFVSDNYTLKGYCEEFEIVPEGYYAPQYEVTVDTRMKKVTFRKL